MGQNKYKESLKRIAIEAYDDVLSGKSSRFPLNFWADKENPKIVTRHLIEDVLKLSEEDLKKNLSAKLFKDNKLGGMLTKFYSNSAFQAINNAYPERKYKEWEFNGSVPKGYWEDERNIKNAVTWLIQKEFNSSTERVKKELTVKTFKNNGLGHLICEYFKENLYEIMNFAYPGQYNEWDFLQVPKGTWEKEGIAVRATKWLIEDHLRFSDEDIKAKISYKLFEDNNLGGMLQTCYNSSPFLAIDAAYPGKFKEWEVCVPKGYWKDKNNGIKAVKWLLEEKLCLSEDEIKEKVTAQFFIDNGLRGMLRTCFKESPYEALEATYPGRFQRWELGQVARGFWDTEENRVKAIKWLVEDRLSLSKDDLDGYISVHAFQCNGLRGMLKKYYKNNPSFAIASVYKK